MIRATRVLPDRLDRKAIPVRKVNLDRSARKVMSAIRVSKVFQASLVRLVLRVRRATWECRDRKATSVRWVLPVPPVRTEQQAHKVRKATGVTRAIRVSQVLQVPRVIKVIRARSVRKARWVRWASQVPSVRKVIAAIKA